MSCSLWLSEGLLYLFLLLGIYFGSWIVTVSSTAIFTNEMQNRMGQGIQEWAK